MNLQPGMPSRYMHLVVQPSSYSGEDILSYIIKFFYGSVGEGNISDAGR